MLHRLQVRVVLPEQQGQRAQRGPLVPRVLPVLRVLRAKTAPTPARNRFPAAYYSTVVLQSVGEQAGSRPVPRAAIAAPKTEPAFVDSCTNLSSARKLLSIFVHQAIAWVTNGPVGHAMTQTGGKLYLGGLVYGSRSEYRSWRPSANGKLGNLLRRIPK